MRRFPPLFAAILTAVLVSAACSGDPADPAAPSGSPVPGAGPGVPSTTGFVPEVTSTTPPDLPSTTSGAATTTTAAATPAPSTTAVPSPRPLDELALRLSPVADGFRQPVFLDAPAGDDRLFVVDQVGTISVLADGARSVFLDLTDRVVVGGEQGLLGLAFHPEFADNGRFFVHYTGTGGDTVVAEYRVGDDPGRADPATARTVFTTPQPAGNHNGGMIAFGPDGHLYVALGDGGGAGDRYGNGQDRTTPLGAILRLDVDGAPPYAIPAGNPFASGEGAPEIWAWGLRNPWRFSFDGGLVFIGDVGQNSWEEIDVVDHRSRGPNFGWPVLEGTHCFADAGCSAEAFVAPVLEYGHAEGHCSVTGGYVYRGAAVPELDGAYFFGDFCSGTIWSFFLDGEGVFGLRDWPALTSPGLTSFGTDGSGELYVVTSGGTVWRLEPAA